MKNWRDAVPADVIDDFDMIEAHVPAYDREAVVRFRGLCEQNLCGDYGRTWACPPGHSTHMDELSRRYNAALILRRTFQIDPKDREALLSATEECKTATRRALASMRSSGIDCRGFSEGGCRYCGTCSYPEPCRYPEALLPSISALGIDLGEYLRSLGEELVFLDDSVTLYTLILFAR